MSEKDVKRAAIDADCDPRTVRRFLRGEAVRTMVGERIRSAVGVIRGESGVSGVRRGE